MCHVNESVFSHFVFRLFVAIFSTYTWSYNMYRGGYTPSTCPKHRLVSWLKLMQCRSSKPWWYACTLWANRLFVSSASPNVSLCLLTFFLTFVFTLSGLVWFGHLMFACHLDFQRIINAHKKTKAALFTLTKSSFVFFYGTSFLLPIIMAGAVVFLQSVSTESVIQ